MSEQHVRALQKRRSEFEDADFQLLLVIATDMGRRHDPARTSQRAIADRASCHYNTVGDRIRKLEARGVVEVIRHGRQYFHSLPTIITDCHPSSQSSQDNHNPPEVWSDNQGESGDSPPNAIVTDYHNFKAEVCDNLKTMTAAIEAMSVQLSQLSSQIVTINQRVIVMEDKIEEIQRRIPSNPPKGKGERKPAAVLTIPESLNNPEFLEEWGKWMAFKGKKLKLDTYQDQLDKLAKEPPEFAAARLERSRLSGWSALWYSDEKPIVINGRTADGQAYQNGRGPGGYYQPPQKPTGIPLIVSTGKGW